MYRGELLFFLLVLEFFSIDFLKDRANYFFDFATLPPKITQWELDSCTRTISIQSVTGGIPPYDFYVFKQDALYSSHWQVYRLIKEQMPQISGLPPGSYRVKAVSEGEGVIFPSFSTNVLAVSFPSDPEIEVKGSTSLCSGRSPAIALQLAHTEDSVPFSWTARVLQAPEEGEVLGYSANPTVPRLGITDTLINTGKTLAKVSYQLQAEINGCPSPIRLVEVQVDPIARVEASSSDSLLCSGTPFSISLLPKSWGASPMQFWWSTEVLFGQVSGLVEGRQLALTTQVPIDQTLTNSGTSPARIRYTFSPSFRSCEGVEEIVEVVVLPELQVIRQVDLIRCAGEWVRVPEFTTNLSGDSLVFFWEVSDPSIGLSSGTGGRIPDFQAVNSYTSSKQALIAVTPILYSQGISCTGPSHTFSITIGAPLAVVEELSDYGGFELSCAGASDGKIKLHLSGGFESDTAANYFYSWIGPEGFISSASHLEGLKAGVYRVRITTRIGACVLEKTITLLQPDPLSIQATTPSNSLVEIPCAGSKSGKIQVEVGGGTGKKTLFWTASNGGLVPLGMENSTVLEGLQVGTYLLRVTDENGCGVQHTFSVTEPELLRISQTKVDNSCFGESSGRFSVFTSGGVKPYRYSWTGPNGFRSTESDLQNLAAGRYQVIVTDANRCTVEGEQLTITEPTALALKQSKVDNVCFQGTSGSITVTPSGGTAPYTYAWIGPKNFSSTLANPQNLASGIYQVTVRDANGCTITGAQQTITEPIQLTLAQTAINNTCFQGTSGSITVTPSGGTAPYRYAWKGPNNFSSTLANPQNLASGTYQVTVRDANGCTITGAQQTITEPAQLALTQSQVNNVCFQGNSASISITATGGTAPYTYSWTGPNNFSATSEDLSRLISGTYQVTVRDANGCTLTGAAQTITEPPVITINAQVQAESCADTRDGQIELTLTGGTPPYTLTWEHGGTTPLASGLGAGTYRVRVTDQSGCSQVGEYTLIPIPPLSLQTTTTLQATQVPLQISALLQANATGGTPPYTYRWSTGQSTSQITVLESGVYGIEILDSKGCSQESEFEVTLPLPMNLSLQVNTVPLCEEGGQETTVQLQLTDGLPPYQITWSRGVPSPDGRVLVTRESGVFDVEVKDALGLVEKRSFTIEPRLTGPLDFSYLFASQAEFQADLVGFDVKFSPKATWPFLVISWDFGDGSSSALLNPSHRYAKKGTYLVTLTVLDDSGCLIKASQEIQVLDYFLEIPNVFTPNGDELNDTFFPKFRFVRNLQLQVMNKWGELIYRSHSQEDPGWDGLVSGQKAPEGVYVYKLRYQVPDGRTITSSSTFLLAR